MSQKCRMDYYDVLETGIVLLLIKFERLMGGGCPKTSDSNT